LKAEYNELETKRKNKNIVDLCSGISEIRNGYRPRKNTIRDEKGDLDRDAYSILDMRRNLFYQFLNV
jgi:hypothetical protein